MLKKIDGVVERCAADLHGHGDHGFYVLLQGSVQIFWLPPARKAYAKVFGRATAENGALVALTSVGDHVSFEVEGTRAKDATFRNWTLEQRLLGSPERDITPADSTLPLNGAKPVLPEVGNE
jgi:hypothetical protein